MARIINNSIVINHEIPLDTILSVKEVILVGVQPFYKYEDGEKTTSIAGYAYTVVETKHFKKFAVKITGQTEPLMESDELEALIESDENTYVMFDNLMVKAYVNSSTGSICDTFTATGIQLMEP